jgi:hypothetical protein
LPVGRRRLAGAAFAASMSAAPPGNIAHEVKRAAGQTAWSARSARCARAAGDHRGIQGNHEIPLSIGVPATGSSG